MAKKNLNVTVDSLSDNALTDSEPVVCETVSDSVDLKLSDLKFLSEQYSNMKPLKVSLGKRFSNFPRLASAGSVDGFFVPLTLYPDSVTDQVHALSLSEQVRKGSGESLSEDLDKDSFDFPDGVDDGSEAHGIFELSNRVDAWIAEQNLSDELKFSFRSQVLQRTADKAMKSTLDSSPNSVSSDSVSAPSVDSESSK